MRAHYSNDPAHPAIRLEPTREQERRRAEERALTRFAGARRWVWNWALEQRKQHYVETGKSLGVSPLCVRLTVLKREPEYAWLREIDSQLLQQAIRDVHCAFTNFFDHRARFPRFKARKRDRARFRIPQRITFSGGCVWLPKIGAIKVRQSRGARGTIKSATCKQDATGHWYITLVEHIPVAPMPPRRIDPEQVIGLDRGLHNLIVSTDGLRVRAPRWYRRSERQLRLASRALSRTQQASHRRRKARRRRALVHQQISNRRSTSCTS
jgi:putative transposase